MMGFIDQMRAERACSRVDRPRPARAGCEGRCAHLSGLATGLASRCGRSPMRRSLTPFARRRGPPSCAGTGRRVGGCSAVPLPTVGAPTARFCSAWRSSSPRWPGSGPSGWRALLHPHSYSPSRRCGAQWRSGTPRDPDPPIHARRSACVPGARAQHLRHLPRSLGRRSGRRDRVVRARNRLAAAPGCCPWRFAPCCCSVAPEPVVSKPYEAAAVREQPPTRGPQRGTGVDPRRRARLRANVSTMIAP